MKTKQAVITDIWRSGSGNGGMLQVEPAFTIRPGQYIQLWRSLGESALPLTAYATSLSEKGQFSVDNYMFKMNPGAKLPLHDVPERRILVKTAPEIVTRLFCMQKPDGNLSFY